MFQLYINDLLMDIPVELGDEIKFEYSQLSIDDIDKRSSAKSFSFKLPLTAVNKGAISNSQQVDNLTKYPYRRLKARAYRDGVDLKIRFAEITSIGEEIEMKLYGSNAYFFQLIGDLEIKDLDFTGQNHFWDFPTITTNLTNSANTPKRFVYPIIDYHSDSPNTLINNTDNDIWAKAMFPSLFYRDLLRSIVEAQGYYLDNDIDRDDTYAAMEMLFPYSGDSFKRDEDGSRYLIKRSSSTDVNTGLLSAQTYYYDDFDLLQKETEYFKRSYNNWRVQIQQVGIILRGAQFADRCRLRGNYSIKLRNTNPNNIIVRVHITTTWDTTKENSGNTETTAAITILPNTDVSIDGSFDLVTTDDVAQVDLLAVRVQYESGIITSGEIIELAGSFIEITECEIIEARDIKYDPIAFEDAHVRNYLTLGRIYGSFKQLDIIANYCKLFCLKLDVDTDKKVLHLQSFNKIPANIGKARNWTDKVDLTTEPAIEFLNDNYGQKSNLKYVIDKMTDKITELEVQENPTGTQGIILVDNENIEDEKDIVTLDFAATIEVTRLIGYLLNQIPVVKDGKIEISKTQRILLARRILNNDTTIDIEDGTYVFGSLNFMLTYFIESELARNPVSLGFENNLIPKNYGALIDIIQNYKLLKLLIRLNAADINQLDFMRPIYLAQFDSYFYLNKVVDYSPTKEESTQVELLKLNIFGSGDISEVDIRA